MSGNDLLVTSYSHHSPKSQGQSRTGATATVRNCLRPLGGGMWFWVGTNAKKARYSWKPRAGISGGDIIAPASRGVIVGVDFCAAHAPQYSYLPERAGCSIKCSLQRGHHRRTSGITIALHYERNNPTHDNHHTWSRATDGSVGRKDAQLCEIQTTVGNNLKYTHNQLPPHITMYTTRAVVCHTLGVYHPGDDIFYIPQQAPDLSPGYGVYHTPCGVMPHNRQDTPKKHGNLLPRAAGRAWQRPSYRSLVVNFNRARLPRPRRPHT